MTKTTEIDIDLIENWNKEFAEAPLQDIVSFATEVFGKKLVMTSSFQTQSVPLLHMIAQLNADIPVVFLDTGFHFPQTLAFRDQLMDRFGLKVMDARKSLQHHEFLRLYGKLYKKDPDKCCHINKTIPLRSILDHYDAWITGVRADQTALRRGLKLFNMQNNGKVKICPIVNWTEHDIYQYIARHNLPDHPLLKKGYMSIGCQPCTVPAWDRQDSRTGRWSGNNKTECGIHKDI